MDSEVDSGSTFLWDCAATGTPKPVMTWKKDNVELLPGKPEHIRVLGNNSLVIRGVKPEDAGQYQCHASNGVGVHVVQAELRVRSEEHLLFLWVTLKYHCLFSQSFQIYFHERCSV